MPIVTDNYTLSLTQDNRILRVRCSQNDTSRQVKFTIYNNGTPFTIPSGLSVSVHGIKQNGNIFTKSCSYSGSVVTLVLGTQITGIAGISVAELVFTDSSGGKIGTSNFIFQVESDPLLQGTISVTEETPTEYISDLISMVEALSARVNNIIAPAGEATLSEVVDARLSGYSSTTYQNLKARIDSDFAALDNTKADKSDTYTKEEVDAAINNVTITTDETLTIPGAPADAKETGDKISKLNESLAHISLSDEVKAALLDCFKHSAWIDNDGPNCYASLHDALYPNTSLDHIIAVFTQGSFVVEPETPLNALKPYLTVTGHYKDGASIPITGYTLSGTLTAGTSTVTVTKDGKTATFNVTVTNNPALIYKLPSGTDISNQAIDTNVPVFGANEDFTILIKAHMTALPNDNNTKYLLNHGYLATGTLRLGLIFNANYKTLTFISNVMYQDNVPISITGNEYACDVMYVIRMRNKRVTKKFYIDNTCYIDKDEDILSYISDKVFTGDYMISAFANTSETNGFFPGVVNLLAIYNSALTDDKIESIMGIEI